MCTNIRSIYNRYINRSVYVNCGKCPSCLQSKAAYRSNRIRNNLSDGELCLFVTLTYDNDHVPYILMSDINKRVECLSVYRDSQSRYVRSASDYSQCYEVINEIAELYSVNIDWDDYLDKDLKFKYLSKKDGKIGVCYFKDLQDFFKRLRYYLAKENYTGRFSYFACSEYGGHSLRPHFHLLLFIPSDYEALFREAVLSAWPYANRDRTKRFIEIARNAASYVSSYVNCGSSVSSLLCLNCFRQKHSYSKGFGVGLYDFQLLSLCDKIADGDLRYYSKAVRDGVPCVSSFPIPKYVINRYFPRCKGFSRITDSEVVDLIQRPYLRLRFRYFGEFEYTDADLHKVIVCLRNAYAYYHRVTGKNVYDYAIDYVSVWRAYSSIVFRDSFEVIEDVHDWSRFYFNIIDYLRPRSSGSAYNYAIDYETVKVRSLSLDDLIGVVDEFVIDPNELVGIKEKSMCLTRLYYDCCKQHYQTNYIMAECLDMNV